MSRINGVVGGVVRPVVRGLTSNKGVGGAVLPTGAIGLWYADQYQAAAAGRNVIPNALATATRTNLLLAPRRLFNNAIGYWLLRTSFADAGLSGPDGSSDASTFTGVGNFNAGPVAAITLTAGTYTIACRAKRNTGSDQPFKMGFYTSPNDISATKTATSSWQWFTHVATRAAGAHAVYHMNSYDGATGVDVQTMDWMLLPGSVTADADLDAAALSALQGDMFLRSAGTAVSYASGELDMASSGRYGLIQFATTKTLTTCTMMALVSKTATGSSYQSFLSKVQDYSKLAGMVQESAATQAYFNGQSLGTSKRQISLQGEGYHLLTVRYNDTTLDYFLDDILIDSKAISTGDVSIQDLFLNITNVTSLFSGVKYAGAVALYDRALTDAEVRTAYAAQKRLVAPYSITPARARILAADGDSITEALTGYFYKYLPNASPVVQGRNFALSGSGLAEVVSREAAVNAFLPPSPVSGKCILTLNVGANLPVGSDMTQFLTDYAALCDRYIARGWKLVICTILPRNDDAFNTRRATINTALRTWVGTHCHAIADFGADATMGTDASSNSGGYDATYYLDGVHPTDAGHVILETIYRPAVNGLLVA